MKKLGATLGLVGFLGLCGCAIIGPLPGSIYTDTKWPSYYEGVDKAGPGPRTGTAMAESYLGWIAVGDASVAAACKNGGIRKIATIDTHGTTILGIYSTWTTIVTGE
ncbi:MAG: TRL-like family protein [Candidatus Binatia bacterium]|jgi:hypothetical protein